MKNAVLTRLESSDQGTFGILSLGEYSWHTVERPWLDNAPNVSCIPTGTYKVRMTWSNRFKRQMYLLSGIPGRSGVRIHPANLAKQLNGCIALGLQSGRIDGIKAVLLSKPAVRQLEQILKGQPFQVEIK